MNQDKLPLSEVSKQLTKDCPAFTLPPLTPEEMERNQAIVEKLLGEVFGQDSEPGE